MKHVLRTLFTAVLLLTVVGTSFAQIPNAGFETWSNGDPNSWSTNNGLYVFVTQSSSAHGGVSAAQGVVASVGPFNMGASLTSVGNSGSGFPISQRYGSVHGFYKFTPVGGDVFNVSFLAEKANAGVGAGAFVEMTTQSVYKEFVLDIMYPGSDVPDEGIITFTISQPGGFPNIGSTFVVDDLTLGSATGVDAAPDGLPTEFRLGQNFPNPFNPTTNITYDVAGQSHVVLIVVDLLGREVAVVVDQVQSAGRYKAVVNASTLTSGVYFYRLTAGNFVETKRLIVVR